MKREPCVWVLIYPDGEIAWTSSRIAAYDTKAAALRAKLEYELTNCQVVKMTPHVSTESVIKLVAETNAMLKKYYQDAAGVDE